MKLFQIFTASVAANTANNMMLPLLMMDDIDDDMMMVMMMNSMGVSQQDSFSQILPLMLLTDDDTTTTTTTDDNTDMFMMMMMMNPGMIADNNALLPLMFLGDGDIDMKSMMLMTSMMQKDCTHDTNTQMSNMLPLLLAGENDNSDKLKTMLMFQMMSEGNGLNMDSMLPMLMLGDDDDELSEVLMMILMSSMGSGRQDASTYDSGFNMMLPLLMSDDDTDTDLMLLLMMMQAQSPSTSSTMDSMLPMMLMKDDDSNDNLLMFMMMSQQQCLPVPSSTSPIVTVKQPEPVEQIVFRTWRLNADGTRTLISTDEHGVEVGAADVMHIADGDGANEENVANGNDIIVGGSDF